MGTSCQVPGDGGGGRSFPSSSSPSSRREQCGVKRAMMDVEFDAALALADLAGMAVPPEMGAESGDSSNGERDCSESSDSNSKSKKRSKESPVRALDRSLQEPNGSKLEEHFNDAGHEGYVASHGGIGGGMQMGTQHNHEWINLNFSCSAGNCSGNGGRAKQNLTEAEKEARRLRRIMANRESARQTIRRRQAHREELTRRVADLSIENKNMKMEKEHVLKEYLSLRDRNEQLKEQIAKTEKTLCVWRLEAESSSSSLGTPTFIKYGKSPFVPHLIPSWFSTSLYTTALCGHGNPSSSTGAAVSLYVPPCAWYYPFDQELQGACAQNPLSVHDSERRQAVLHPHLSIGGDDKSHISDRKPEILFAASGNRKENPATGSRVVPGRMFRDEEAIKPSSEDNDMLSMTIGLSLEDKRETRRATSVQELLQSACTRTPEKSAVGATAAAAAATEARRRRKELTKLKHLT